MLNRRFCHLHLHTEHSTLDGYGTAQQYVSRAKEMDFKYLACTDHGNVDGLIKFQQECDKQGIQPVLGCEAYIVPDMKDRVKKEKRAHIVFLVKNSDGWRTLCKLLTKANIEGFYYKPRLDYKTVLSMDMSGLIVLTACAASFVQHKEGLEMLKILHEKHKNVYLEIMPHRLKEQIDINNIIYDIHQKYDIPLVATNDCHYVLSSDNTIQEVLLAIQSRSKWDDKDRWSFGIKEGLHLRSADEMMYAFQAQSQFGISVYNQALRNTAKVAKQCCDFRIPKQKPVLPIVHKSPNKELKRLCMDRSYGRLPIGELIAKKYKDRMNEELQLIRKKDFAQYFLIVKDLIDWCRKNDIMVGPGRGSVGGSLVSWLIGITEIDPIKYDLLFSRFINEGRIDYPDIDIDFQDSKRDLVRQYLEDTYGHNNVAGISTFLTMKGRGAIRDVARVFNIPNNDVDVFAKAMKLPDDEGKFIKKCVNETDEGKYFNTKYKYIVDYAIRLEGQIKSSGQHPAAVVISENDLTQGDNGNLCMRKGVPVSNWSMQDSEYAGLMKLDVLGLNTLSILNETKHLVGIDKFKYKDNCKHVFKTLSEGKTVGVFQLSTYTGTDICKRMGIDSFNHIVAVLALGRPGAMDTGMTDDYIERKNGEQWNAKNDIYEEVTKDTYGCVIYQEQIMQIIHKVAGMSYSDSDNVRKIIAKKRDTKQFKEYEQRFINGCLKEKTLSKQEAIKFWSDLQAWSNYGFNMAHSVGYGMLAYRTCYCKVHYPVEFISASLTHGGETKKNELVKEAINLGLNIIPPKVGVSDAVKWIAKDGKMYMPFIEIKGVGDGMASQCVDMVQKKPKRTGFFKLEENTKKPKRKIDKALDEIGAFNIDSVGFHKDYFSSDFLSIKGIEIL